VPAAPWCIGMSRCSVQMPLCYPETRVLVGKKGEGDANVNTSLPEHGTTIVSDRDPQMATGLGT